MVHPGLPFFSLLLVSSLNLTGQQNHADSTKSFSSNIYWQSNKTITITYMGNKVLAERSESKILNDFDPYNILFPDTKNIELSTDGLITPTDPNQPIWFIPFEFGAAAFPLGSYKALRYNCNCKGLPDTSSGGICTIINTGDSLWCSSVRGMSCFINEKGCIGVTGTYNTQQGLFYDFFSSGVLVEADTVLLKDPEYFKPNPNAPIEFIEDENFNIYLRSDYEKMKGIKKD